MDCTYSIVNNLSSSSDWINNECNNPAGGSTKTIRTNEINMKKIVLSFLLINVILWTLDIGFEMFINNLYYLIYISIGLILVSVGLSIWIIIKKDIYTCLLLS